jgi:fibronectin type 3 domain-containing protein
MPLQRTVGALPQVDGAVVDISRQPLIANPWMSQPYQQDPKAPCELTVSIDGKTRIYDLKDYAIRTHVGPARPTHVVASVNARQVDLRWRAAPGQPTSYRILRATGQDPLSEVGTSTTANWRDTTVQAGTTYRYSVAAGNAGGFSPESVAIAVTPSEGIPSAPERLVATPGDGVVRLAWATSPGATSYHVWRTLMPGGPYERMATVTGTTAEDLQATNFTTRWYVVTAIGAGGESGCSAEDQALPSSLRPAIPTGVTFARGERTVDGKVETGFTIAWKAVPDAVRYNIRTSATARGLPITRGIARGTTTAFITDAHLAKAPWITVSAINGAGDSTGSDPVLLPVPELPKTTKSSTPSARPVSAPTNAKP